MVFAIKTSWPLFGTAAKVRTNSLAMFSYGLQRMDTPVLADKKKLAHISYVRPLDAVQRTCKEQWPIGTDGEIENKRNLCCRHTVMMMMMNEQTYKLKSRQVEFFGLIHTFSNFDSSKFQELINFRHFKQTFKEIK